MYSVSAVGKINVSCRASQIAGSEKAKQSSVTYNALAGQRQQSLCHC